jgi:hypothetical protein
MPNTTNAEEAMHWRFYSATGRDHSFMHGMKSLYKIAMDFERQFDVVNSACSPSLFLRKTNYFSEGIPIRYRRPEAWKVIAAEIGRTKPTCAEKPNEKKRKKNDGRPPDTIKELLNKSTNQTLRGVPRETEEVTATEPTKKLSEGVVKEPPKNSKKNPTKKTSSRRTFGPPSYPWKNNSCWLDTALELLYIVLMRDHEEFLIIRLDYLDENSALKVILGVLEKRWEISLNSSDGEISSQLGKQQDEIRGYLCGVNLVDNLRSFEAVFVSAEPYSNKLVCSRKFKGWFWELVRKDSLDAVEFRPFSYFQTLAVDIERCSGCESTGGKHLRISNPLRTKRLASLAVSLHAAYQGKVTDWFQTYISMEDVTNPVDRCWRNYSDSQTNPCSGKRKDTTNLVVSLPVILILEVEAPLPLISGDSNYQGPPVWDFPATLFPSTQEMADDNRLIFDIVGLVLASMSQSHFVARYISQDDSRIFEYDGKQYGDFPVLNKSAKVNTHLVGTKIRLPVGFHVHQAVYRLRGGIKAQDQFFQVRRQAYQEKFNLSIAAKSVDVLPQVSYIGDNFVAYSPPRQTKLPNCQDRILILQRAGFDNSKVQIKRRFKGEGTFICIIRLFLESRIRRRNDGTDKATDYKLTLESHNPTSKLAGLTSKFPIQLEMSLWTEGRW